MPGVKVAEGDVVCGRALGPAITAVDCTSETALPSDLVAEHIAPSASDWTPADVGIGSGGCELLAQHHEIVAIDSTGIETPDMTLIADFVPVDFTGSLGLRVACSLSGSCVDIALYSDNSYELDEGNQNNNWKTLTSGPLVFAHLRPDAENRLILRFADGRASVYLNGVEFTSTAPDLPQESGYIGFYADNEESSQIEHVQLKRLYAFTP
jgi:hypothetical protein